jgi:uncharacterized cupredoxin-like copper-binding protein
LQAVPALFGGVGWSRWWGENEAKETAEEVAEGPSDTIEVNETEFSLEPDEITLDRRGVYVFKAENAGRSVYALEIEGNGIEEETEDTEPGESAELEVNLEPGTYELYCPVGNHEERGMVGTVTVRES